MKSKHLLLLAMLIAVKVCEAQKLTGAWTLKSGTIQVTVLFQDGYYSSTGYDIENKMYIATTGGTYTSQDDKLSIKYGFYTSDKEKVGTTETLTYRIKGSELTLITDGNPQSYNRVDDGQSPLAGHWLITGRVVNGNMQTITPGARRTIKLLTGTRFQWIAINVETKEFFGTGGGTYTFVNGKYTETIEFFSRDSSRVGASLSFDGKVEGNNWHHSGLSSRGEPIHEIWTKN